MGLTIRVGALALVLIGAAACQAVRQVDLNGPAGPMERMLAAARGCGIRHFEIRRAREFEPDRKTYVHMPRVRPASWRCLMEWRRAHPDDGIYETVIA
jgi:hypothetical protein